MTITVLVFPDEEVVGSVASRRIAEAGGRVEPVRSWDSLSTTVRNAADWGLLLVSLKSLQEVLRSKVDGQRLPMARWPDGPMARWPDGPMARWYTVGVWAGGGIPPTSVHSMMAWGLSEIRGAGELADRRVVGRLLNRACFGRFGYLISQELVGRLGPDSHHDLNRLVDAILSALAGKKASPAEVARRLHMSRSTLDRFVLRMGLVPPATLVQRTRLIVAYLLRTVPGRRSAAWKELGFYSHGHLSTRMRSHFGMSVREADQMGSRLWTRVAAEKLVRGAVLEGC